MTEPERLLGSAGQTFLVGDSLYLRPLELGDAARAGSWRGSPFPVPAARAEDFLKQEIPKEMERRKVRFVACRRADDAPVGAVVFEVQDWRTASVVPTADVALGADGSRIKAEIVRLIVPWLVEERHLTAVWVELDAGEPDTLAAAGAIGMRPAARLREAIWRNGARHDQVVYERLHAGWVERLGDPGPGIAEATEPVLARPRRAAPATRDGPVPANAIAIGERVYLRPLETEDVAAVARASREESETFFDNGRGMRSPLHLGQAVAKMGEHEPPDEIEMAVVLRDGGELIGDVGLYGIDWVHRTAETGSYLYRSAHRGAGFGSEAKHLLLAYAFDRLGLHMVRSFVWGPNTRSAAALRKQGYRDAGRLRWSSHRGGGFADEFVFDLLADEWRAGRGTGAGESSPLSS